MSRKPDTPYVAIATITEGEMAGAVQLVDNRRLPESPHSFLRMPGETHRIVVDLGDILTPDGYNEGLKVSRVGNAQITAGRVLGGAEDVLDMTASSEVAVAIDEAVPRGQYVATIKGECARCSVNVYRQNGHGRVTDYDLGNWFDYNRGKTTGIKLYACLLDDSAARCRVLRADRPELPEGWPWQVTLPWWRPLFLYVYPLLKAIKLA